MIDMNGEKCVWIPSDALFNDVAILHIYMPFCQNMCNNCLPHAYLKNQCLNHLDYTNLSWNFKHLIEIPLFVKNVIDFVSNIVFLINYVYNDINV